MSADANRRMQTQERVTVVLGKHVRQRVAGYAQQDRRSLSNWIRRLCEDEIERRITQESTPLQAALESRSRKKAE